MTAAASIDAVLVDLWNSQVGERGAALVAVGGYGRGELHPYSDLDVMLLLPDELSSDDEDALSTFVTSLWDVGLEIGHSVRTLAQCAEEAAADLTVATTLMEARLLAGPSDLFDAMQDVIAPDKMWPPARFFEEKRKEQIARHHRYHDTAYNLEPNVKSSPGGLRDIQMIGWVAKRQFGAATLAELVDHEFLTPGQLQRLQDGEGIPVAHPFCTAHIDRASRRSPACSITSASSLRCSDTKMRAIRWLLSSSCSATTARSWSCRGSTRCCYSSSRK